MAPVSTVIFLLATNGKLGQHNQDRITKDLASWVTSFGKITHQLMLAENNGNMKLIAKEWSYNFQQAFLM